MPSSVSAREMERWRVARAVGLEPLGDCACVCGRGRRGQAVGPRGAGQLWDGISAPPLGIAVPWGRVLELLGPQSPHLQHGMLTVKSAMWLGCQEDQTEHMAPWSCAGMPTPHSHHGVKQALGGHGDWERRPRSTLEGSISCPFLSLRSSGASPGRQKEPVCEGRASRGGPGPRISAAVSP